MEFYSNTPSKLRTSTFDRDPRVLIKPSWYGNWTVSSLRGSDDWRTELVTVQRNQRFGLKSMRSLYTFLASYVCYHFISNIHFIYVAIAIQNILSIINRYAHTPKYQYVTISGVHNGDYHNTVQDVTLRFQNTGGRRFSPRTRKNCFYWTACQSENRFLSSTSVNDSGHSPGTSSAPSSSVGVWVRGVFEYYFWNSKQNPRESSFDL